MKNILNLRRVEGLFASIRENGAMISLAGKWVGLDQIKSGSSKGLESRVVHRTKMIDGVKTTVDVIQYRISSLSDLLGGFGWRVIFAVFPNAVKVSGRLRVVKLFSGYIYRMYKNHGAAMTVKYLKAAQLACQKSIAKDRINSLTELAPEISHSRLTGFKLPVIIPSRDRKLINGKSHSIIRFYLTLFSVYRVIELPGQLKLQTIIEPLTVPLAQIVEVRRDLQTLLMSAHPSALFTRRAFKKDRSALQLLETASSTQKVSWIGMFTDPALLLAYSKQYVYVKKILELTGQGELSMFFETMNCLATPKVYPEPIVAEVDSPYKGVNLLNPINNFIGKLSIKSEAAGKERVFAMVDFWTQQSMKPIHDEVFSLLRKLPNDGTFDQAASVKRAAALAVYFKKSFGFDLSAATDRLPVMLQSVVVDFLIPGLGSIWSAALTERGYYLYLPHYYCKEQGIPYTKKELLLLYRKVNKSIPHPGFHPTVRSDDPLIDQFTDDEDIFPTTINVDVKHLQYVPQTIIVSGITLPLLYDDHGKPYVVLKYAVGQPMGALSSWAMLAITHHLLVQIAFRRAFNIPTNVPLTMDTWYDDYELLGDDIILFDSKVAAEYLRLMEYIGVPINTSKSVCAKTAVAEFAKVTTLDGVDVSALSWKMFMSGNTLMGRANTSWFLLRKGFISKHIIKYVSRFNRLSQFKLGNPLPTFIALWSMLSNSNIITVEDALAALIDGTTYVFKLGKAILMNADAVRIYTALPRLVLNQAATQQFSKRAALVWNVEKTWFGIHMWKPLAVFQHKGYDQVSLDAMELTKAMLGHCPFAQLDKLPDNPLLMDHGTFFVNGSPTLNGIGADMEKNDQIVLFGALYTLIYNILMKKAKPLLDFPVDIDSPLANMAENRESLDRYNETLLLVDRAELKLDPEAEVIPARQVRPTSLKLIKLLRKMANRPLFTTAHSLF
jgi:hypothetical protein